MISKSKIKLIKSLAHKKFRKKENLFLVEGNKNILELLRSDFNVVGIWATHSFLLENKACIPLNLEIDEVSHEDIKKASLLKNPQQSLAICEIPGDTRIPIEFREELTLFLDGIQDPGNLGTILRICDWFNINQIYCSPDSADLYNPKVIQASMGSFCRCKVRYSEFETIAESARANHVKIYGAFLNGNNIFTTQFSRKVLIVIGNEGQGIRNNIENHILHKIMIPEFKTGNGPESINAAVAAGIICSEIKRQLHY